MSINIYWWSAMCFLLGMAFMAGLYYLRVQWVVRHAEKKLDELKEGRNGNH